MSKPRAAVYLRQSTYREESISLELQERACRDYATAQGYEVVAVESDPGISGRTWNRPGVQKVMGLVESQDAEVILLWKWSRLSRSRLDWAVAADKVETLGGRIESATEPVDVSTSVGRFARGMLTEFAAFESERIGDTWKESHARRIRNGLPHHGLPRFGYTYTKAEGYKIDPLEGEVLREMYLRYIRGESMFDLVRYAKEAGYGPEGGWAISNLRRMLDRGFGAGYIWTKGELIDGAHEGVISKEEFASYQVRRESRAKAPRSESTDYPFTGLLRCHCGARMAGHTVPMHGKRYPRYVCLKAQQKHAHTQTAISARYVEKAVKEWLEGVAEEVNRAGEASRRTPRKNTGMERKAQQLAADVQKNAARIDTLLVKYLDGEVSAEVYTRMNTKLAEEKAALEARQRLVQVNSAPRPTQAALDLLRYWDEVPGKLKREMLRRLLDKIQLHDWEEGGKKRKITVHEHGWD